MQNHSIIRISLLSLFFLLISQELFSQPLAGAKPVKGIVSDRRGEPITGASISLVGEAGIVSVTDETGRFSALPASSSRRLLVRCVGYEDREVSLTGGAGRGRQPLHIVLNDASIVLDEVVVYSTRNLTAPGIIQARQEQRRIAGSVSIAEMKPRLRRLTTLKDAIGMQPGVIIQEFFGSNDQPRLNIRGSGIQSNPQRRGVYLMQDGIPVNFADGSYIIGVMDPMTARYVEVFKGANALTFGAGTLGGAVNFVSRTGQSDAGLTLKADAGSHLFRTLTLSGGFSRKGHDFHATASYSGQKGYRVYNRNDRFNLSANYGMQSADGRWQNRTFASFTYLDFQFPGPLNMDQLMEDPRRVNPGVDIPFTMGPNVLRDKPSRQARMMRIAHRLGIRLSSLSDLTLALYYQYADDRFVFPITISIPHSYYHDLGATLHYRLHTGRHLLKAALTTSYGTIDRRTYINKDGLESFMFAKDDLRAKNLTLLLEEDYALSARLHIVADLHAVCNERNSRDVFPDPTLRPWYSHMSHKYRYFRSENSSMKQAWYALNPRVGLVWNPSRKKDIQCFANLSRSFEAPTFDELVGTEVTSNINTSPKKLFAIRLDKQTATTIEAGTKGRLSRISWNLAYYYSDVNNELLEVKDYVRGIKRTENYPHTVHQGIELGVNAKLMNNRPGNKSGTITLGATYAYSDFRFKGGKYHGKRLAGIPKHYINTEATYEHTCGLQLSAGCEWNPTETPVDHTNTLFQPTFRIWNARAGYTTKRGLSIYIEMKNITALRYASSYIISDEIHNPPVPFPGFSAKQMTFFIPGMPRTIYTGATWEF